MGWWITAGVLILLAILPLGVSIFYDAAGPLVKVILGPLRLTVFPLPKKEKKEKPEKKKKETEQASPPVKQIGADQPPKKETPKEEKAAGGSILDFLPLVQILFDFLGDFRRKLRVNYLELKLILAADDPCDLAVNYGRTWAAVGSLLPQLEKIFVIQKRDIDVSCDFTAANTTVLARLELTITLGRLLAAILRFAFRALKTYLTIQKTRKGGAKQ